MITEVERYGTKTFEDGEADAMRRDRCLCRHCALLKCGQPDNCQVAEALFKLCKDNGMATCITRCKHWRTK